VGQGSEPRRELMWDKDAAVKSRVGAFLLVLVGLADIFRYIDSNVG
jgi:hypothetical protein